MSKGYSDVGPPANETLPTYDEVCAAFADAGVIVGDTPPPPVAASLYPEKAYPAMSKDQQPQSYPPQYPPPAFFAPESVDLPYASELTRDEIEAPAPNASGKFLAGVSFLFGNNRVRCQACNQQLAWNTLDSRFAKCPRCHQYSVRAHVKGPHTEGMRYVRCRCTGLFLVPKNTPGYICPRERLVYYLDAAYTSSA